MSTTGSNSAVPTSWEDEDEEMTSNAPPTSLMGRLNVNAPVFTMNVQAKEFVMPSFSSPAAPVLPAVPPPQPQPTFLPQPPIVPQHHTTANNHYSSITNEEQDDEMLLLEASRVGGSGTSLLGGEDEAEPSFPSLPSNSATTNNATSTSATKTPSSTTTGGGGGGGTSTAAVPKEKKIVKRDIIRKKEPVNIVFCGHVDAGKSTIGGQLMFLTGQVDKRTLEKYQNEAREQSRESWYLSWALDTNEEERAKGKTVEVGRAWFETEKKHFIILDAPGHRCFVPNMIGGASQADIAILVISARKGEFETGFERGGQTREHAMLVKTAGVRYLVVLINKMDDPTVGWDEARYEEIKDKLTPFLKKTGFKMGEDTIFMPCSGMSGAMLKEHPGDDILPWFKGPAFIDYLDHLPSFNRSIEGPLRMPIVDRYKEMGTIIMGKIESGVVRVGDKCILMPNRQKVEVMNIYYEDFETDSCVCGENVRIKLKNVEEEEISPGFVLCDVSQEVCQVGRVFDAQVAIVEHKSIICPGYSAVLHVHTAAAEVQLKALITLIDRKTGERNTPHPRFIKQDQVGIARFELAPGTAVCMEPFKKFPQLGRFTLRDEGKTVAVGKVLKIIE